MNAISYIVDGGSGAQLGPKPAELLRFMMVHPNVVHTRLDLAKACQCSLGRSVDTYVAQIRRALGASNLRIASESHRGYAWLGGPVKIIQSVRGHSKASRSTACVNRAVMTQEEVSRRLGIPLSQVKLLERKALKKLADRPELKQAWLEMLREKQRFAYDPFHEIWLYAVQERFPRFGVNEKERVVEDKL